MIKVITSKNNDKIKYVVSLKDNKNRKKEGKFIGEGKKSLQLALQAGLVEEVYTYDTLLIDENIPQYLVNEEVMKKLSSSVNPEGVVFVANVPSFKKDKYNKILFLDSINDPGNLGTLTRTALAFGYDAVVTSKDSVSVYNEKTLAACKGANYLIPVFQDDLSNYKDDYQIIVSTLKDSSIDLDEVQAKDSFVLVLGNEAHGVSKNTEQLADVFVKIPIQGINSLNVAVAGGILMYKIH